MGLVGMANMATRRMCGDFVWFSYDLSHRQGHKRQPKCASTLVGLTKQGARIFLDEMNKQKAAHFDVFIFAFGESRMHNNSCYVYPPVGNYDAHEGGTQPGTRESLFDSKWLIGQPGWCGGMVTDAALC